MTAIGTTCVAQRLKSGMHAQEYNSAKRSLFACLREGVYIAFLGCMPFAEIGCMVPEHVPCLVLALRSGLVNEPFV